jgi:hypothetical protein
MRLDRGSMYAIPIWFGFLLTGIYVLIVPYADPVIPDRLENVLGAAMVASGVLCLTGAAIDDKLLAYKLEFVGLLISFSVLIFIGFHTPQSLFEQFTFAGSLGAIIQIGSFRMMWQLGLAIREIKAAGHDSSTIKPHV